MAIVALISCTKSKKNYPCKAREMYNERSPWFHDAYSFAKLTADDIFILSAKYGLLQEDQFIEPYNETLNDKSDSEKKIWADKVVTKLKDKYDVLNSEFIIIAGKSYYEYIIPQIKTFWLPLYGKNLFEWSSELKRLKAIERDKGKVDILHILFNDLPRYDWTMINKLDFNNGIYVMFEKGELYKGIDRIVRVGTHRSDNRLMGRLQDHFIKEDSDGSIFRKNIGRIFIDKYFNSYSTVWELDIRKESNHKLYVNLIDKKIEIEVERRITEYLKSNITFTCFPVDTCAERLRLEEGIISCLNQSTEFYPSENWLGNRSPISDIAKSGLWNREGLKGIPLTDDEVNRVTRLLGSSMKITTIK